MKILRVLWTAIKRFYTDRSMQSAAAMSFYVLFSLFPLLICLIWIAGGFLKNPEIRSAIIRGLLSLIPLQGSDNLVIQAIHAITTEGPTTGIVGFIVMIWSGTAMFRMMRDALNETLNVATSRPYLMQRLIDFVLMLGVGAFFFLSITITALVHSAPALAKRWNWIKELPFADQLLGESAFLWQIVSSAVPVFLSAAAFFVIYATIPNVRKPALQIGIASIVAAILFEFLKNGFGWYVSAFARYDVVFGPLATVVAFLFWVYLGAIILLFGAQLLAAFPEKKKGVI